MTDSTAKPAVERRHVSDTEVWLVAAVSYKGERFTHGYAFFSEASALCYIECEELEDAERAKIGRTELHVSDSWQVVRYVPEQASERTEAWVKLLDAAREYLSASELMTEPSDGRAARHIRRSDAFVRLQAAVYALRDEASE